METSKGKRPIGKECVWHRSFSGRDMVRSVLLFGGACMLSTGLQAVNSVGGYEGFVLLVFVLTVALTARFTDGYFWGVAMSLAGVICVNYVFAFPYMAFSFSLAGYLLTFLIMLGLSVIISGMTSQIKRNEQLQAEAKQEHMRVNLLRALSHDIRTPLSSIVGVSGALMDGGGQFSPKQREQLLRDMNEDAQWLIRMVENLLSITRMEEGVVLCKRLEAPEEVMGAAAGKFSKRFAQLKIDVLVPAVFFLVPMDPVLIEQVLLNLMDNAVTHGRCVTKICLSVVKKETQAEFMVEDDGCGISPQGLRAGVEGVRRQVDSGHSETKRNLGIGLCACTAIVKAHGGHLTARNRNEGGACVKFTLPLEEEHHEDQR